MSLINDALRRAQQTQPPLSPAAFGAVEVPPMRPVEPRRQSSDNHRWVLLFVALIFLGGASCALWFGLRQVRALPQSVADNSVKTPPVSHSPPPVAPPTATEVKPPLAVAPLVQTNTVIVLVTNVVAAAPAVNSIPIEPPPPPVFPALKLQGIFYRPSNPSVVINGQTLSVNDEVANVKVAAITKSSVTVVWAGQTNVLTLR